MRLNHPFFSHLTRLLPAIAVLGGLFVSSLYSYLLFHTLIELFSIVIACAVFVLAWNFRRFYRDSFLIFIGTAYLFCSLIDLVHTLAYKGMGIFQGYDSNLPTQLWLAARYLQSVSLLIAPFFLRRKVRIEGLLAGFVLVTTLLLLSIFAWEVFPTSYIEGVGLTPFKIASEYTINLFFAAAILHLLQKSHYLDRKVLHWMIASIGLTMLGELAFTFYVNVYGLSNLVGHFVKVIAYFYVYKATIETEAGSIYTDITQLRVAERALRESERQAQRSLAELQSIYAHTPIGLCFFDTQLRYQAINETLAQVNGLPPADHIGKTLQEVLSPRIAQAIEPNLRQVLATGQPVLNQEINNVVSSQTGLAACFLVSYHPVFDIAGTSLGVSCVVQDITEQRQAKEALQSSEHTLKLFIEYAPAGIAMFDREMRYLAASRRFLTSYHLTEQDVIGRSHYELFPYIPERWKAIHRRSLAGAVEQADEDSITQADGSIEWLRWAVHPWYTLTGEIGGMILFTENITERKQMQAALEERAGQLRILGDHLPDGALYRYVKDHNGIPHFELMSAGIEGITGVPADEVLRDATSLHKTILLEDYQRLLEEETLSVEQLTPFEMEIRQRHRVTGEIHWSLIRAKPSRRVDESTVWDGIQIDITDRKRAEASLRESEKRFRSVVEANMIGVVFADADTGVVIDANDEFLRIIGHSREALEAGAINWHTITPPDGLDQEEQGRLILPSEKSRRPFEKEYIRPDGTRVPVIIGGSYLDDTLHHMVAFVLDNSERKRMTEELAQANSALLAYAEKLKNSNQELEQFAFVASHDLQEPLRKIKLFGNRLKTQMSASAPDALTEEAADSLARMQNAADRMETMISGLLELSRINTQRGTFEPTQLTSLIEEVVNDLEARLQSTGGQIIVNELYSAEVDAVQIRRLFQNLIGNALKFHKPDMAPVIEISGGITRSLKQSSITIAVKDNGIGFDEQYTTRIFQPFQRLHGRDEYDGTGLGLSICQKIVERHHGTIEAHSQPGEGAIFCITLPVHQPVNENP